MFIPCDECLRRNAIHTLEVTESGKRQSLRLCKACYEQRGALEELSKAQPGTSPEDNPLEAASLSYALLQEELPRLQGFDLAGFYHRSPGPRLSHLDFIRIDSNLLGILIAEVSGPGLAASRTLDKAIDLLRSESMTDSSPAATLARVNRLLARDIPRGLFLTAYYVLLSVEDRTLACASAGHRPLVLWRKASNSVELVNPNGLALGIDPGPLFEKTLKVETLTLEPGDRFTLFTDAVVEVAELEAEPAGDSWLYRRIKDYADQTSRAFLGMLLGDLERYSGQSRISGELSLFTGRLEPGA